MNKKFDPLKHWGYISFICDFELHQKYKIANPEKHKIDCLFDADHNIIEQAINGWNNENHYKSYPIHYFLINHPNIKVAWSLK